MLQYTSHEVYVYIGCVPKLYLDVRTFALYGADTPKQDACYCEFYWAVNFVVHDTVTILYLTTVRNTVGFSPIHHHRDKLDTTADPGGVVILSSEILRRKITNVDNP